MGGDLTSGLAGAENPWQGLSASVVTPEKGREGPNKVYRSDRSTSGYVLVKPVFLISPKK
jgi:hypothetical protein